MKAVVDVVAFLGILYLLWRLVSHTAQWFFDVVANRFDLKPEPHGAHPMPYGHPEREQLDLSYADRALLHTLDTNTEWERA